MIYWLGQVGAIWNGQSGFRATVDMEPSKYRLPRLVETNVPLLGRYNVIVGLMTESSSTPPSPLAPPPIPSFPPIDTETSGFSATLLIAVILVSAVCGIGACTLVYFYCRRPVVEKEVKKEVLHNPFVSSIKIHADIDDQEGTEMLTEK